MRIQNTEVSLVLGDITCMPHVDAVVNAANEQLRPGSGVCGAIFGAAGRAPMWESCQEIAIIAEGSVRCPTGQARVTPAHGLPNKMVVHAVGPIFDSTRLSEQKDQLAKCYEDAIVRASRVGASSIAFPAISCGIYKFPLTHGALSAYEGIRKGALMTSISEVKMVFLPDNDGPALFEKFRQVFETQYNGSL